MFKSLKFSSETLGADLGSGFTVALVSMPKGMAEALAQLGMENIFPAETQHFAST